MVESEIDEQFLSKWRKNVLMPQDVVTHLDHEAYPPGVLGQSMIDLIALVENQKKLWELGFTKLAEYDKQYHYKDEDD